MLCGSQPSLPLPVLPAPTLAAAAAADLGVDESEDVRQDVPDVGQAQQHERDAQHSVGDAHQTSPHRLGGDVAIPCTMDNGINGFESRKEV